MPSHPVALDLLARYGPMVVSSANLTGHPPPRGNPGGYARFNHQVSDGAGMGPEEVSEADPEAGAVLVLPRSGHVDQEGAISVGFCPHVPDSDCLGQQTQGSPSERVVLIQQHRLWVQVPRCAWSRAAS